MKLPPAKPDMENKTDITSVRDVIVAMTAEVVGRRLLPSAETTQKGFGTLGIDSVSIFQLQQKLEEVYPFTLPDDFLIINNTPDQAAEAIVTLLNSHASADV